MTFTQSVKTCFGKYLTFAGRAARPEYWWFALFVFAGGVILAIVDAALFEGETRIRAPVFQLATLLPLLAAGWRRMHDTGRPGWYILLPMIISVAGTLLLLLGVVGFATLEAEGADPEALRGPASVLGLGGIGLVSVLQLVALILLIWWLTRPGDPGDNRFGPPPVR